MPAASTPPAPRRIARRVRRQEPAWIPGETAPVKQGGCMKTALASIAVVLVLAALTVPGLAQEKLGKVTFPTSCDAKVQAQFERGVAMLHSYWFTEARKVFESVLQQDPACAIAYWGLAVNYLGNSLAAAPPPKDAAAASEALDRARAIGAKTQRERDWIEAIGVYYRDHDKAPLNARMSAYTKAMEQLSQRYPDDFEASAYYALTLQASAPKNDKTYANQLKSAEILERLFKQNPDHPGVAHYLVHAYDYPPLADKGIKIAALYGKLAPAAPHARHMPSHIYSMVGMWEDSIASNRSALEIQPDYYHATDFVVYAHLQLAQDAKAKTLVDQIAALPKQDYPNIAVFTAVAVVPARYALERGDWAGAAKLPVVSTGRAQADSLVRFTRGLGMAGGGFEASLKENPNRYRGLYGAARAAEAAGDRQKAAGYFEKLVALASKADTVRPETARAKAFLGQR